MKKLDTVVWGIIGAGNVCEKKSAPALSKIPFSEVKTIMRRNAKKAEDFARRHQIDHWTTSLEELLNDPEINAVYIATPPNSHAELTIKAAKAGKAVYVEKPMANTPEECEEMINACKKADVPLFVAYYRRALQGFLKVKDLIDQGAIGEVRCLTVEMYKPIHDADLNSLENWRVIPEIAGGGYFHDLAAHQLDYFDFLFGPIVKVHGLAANQAHAYPSDDVVTATFQFENGVIGSGIWCFSIAEALEKDTITILGSKGSLSFNCFGSPMHIRMESAVAGNQAFVFEHQQPIQQPFIQQIVNELRGIGSAPSNGISGMRTTAVMSTITHANKV